MVAKTQGKDDFETNEGDRFIEWELSGYGRTSECLECCEVDGHGDWVRDRVIHRNGGGPDLVGFKCSEFGDLLDKTNWTHRIEI